MKQTAVEWLKEKWYSGTLILEKDFEQAKAMEKEQMIQVAMYHKDSCVEMACIESYINKHFKSE